MAHIPQPPIQSANLTGSQPGAEEEDPGEDHGERVAQHLRHAHASVSENSELGPSRSRQDTPPENVLHSLARSKVMEAQITAGGHENEVPKRALAQTRGTKVKTSWAKDRGHSPDHRTHQVRFRRNLVGAPPGACSAALPRYRYCRIGRFGRPPNRGSATWQS